MTKSMILPCLLSGLFGAIFAAACGVVDGVGSKEANADTEIALTKTIYEGDCDEGYIETGFYPTGEEIIQVWLNFSPETSDTYNPGWYPYTTAPNLNGSDELVVSCAGNPWKLVVIQ